MATQGIVTAADARAAATAWLMDHLPDRFAAGIPTYDTVHQCWHLPVWLTYPGLSPLGPVGDLWIDAVSGDVQAHTPLAQMHTRALHLYDQHRAAIDAPLS
jgi:hypothetical protein